MIAEMGGHWMLISTTSRGAWLGVMKRSSPSATRTAKRGPYDFVSWSATMTEDGGERDHRRPAGGAATSRATGVVVA